MTKHTCKNCNSIFEYCRGCLLSPIPHKDAGYCSKDCYEASKIKVVPIVEIEPVVEEITTVEIEELIVEDEIQSSTEAVQPIDEEASIEVLDNTETIIETTTVAEPTIKQETYNAYKKKKKKHR